jgi:hypothetical protein
VVRSSTGDRVLRNWRPIVGLVLGLTSFTLLSIANPTFAQLRDSSNAALLDAGTPSGGLDASPAPDAGAASSLNAVPAPDSGAASMPGAPRRPSTESSDPVFTSRSSTTVGPPAPDQRLPPPPEVAPRSDKGFESVTTLDFEAGSNPLHPLAPLMFGAGLGFRALSDPANPIVPSARFVMLALTFVDAVDDYTKHRNQASLWGAVPLLADLDVYGRLGRTFRLGISTRAGVYFAPRLYPLFALGIGVAADIGNHRFELMTRIQPLPTMVSTTGVSREEIWARSQWIIVPTLRISVPIGK